MATTLVNTQSLRVERSDRLAQWYTNDWRPVARETKFCTERIQFVDPQTGTLTLLELRILRFSIPFWKTSAPLS